jgi:hypothetical protein
VKGTVSRDFIVFLPILTVRWYFFVRYFFVKSIKIGPLISHIFRITNHRSLFLLKTSIYIQIVIRWASIHRLSICIIDLPTTGRGICKTKQPSLLESLLKTSRKHIQMSEILWMLFMYYCWNKSNLQHFLGLRGRAELEAACTSPPPPPPPRRVPGLLANEASILELRNMAWLTRPLR